MTNQTKMPKRQLTNEQQNVLRVIAAALLAVVIAFSAAIFQCGQPDAHVVALCPAMFGGIPIGFFNIVVWRVKMHW